ncbi:type II secretion system major pseudopilin GspG [bacterium]|nr:type II secretion system major pseudopilin GspG [bacterium]
MHKNPCAGFTLVELILVVAILGILTSVVAINYTDGAGRAKRHAAQTQIRNLEVALSAFNVHMGRYPSSEEGLAALVDNLDGSQDWAGPYLMSRQVPVDPWRHAYVYDPQGQRGVAYDLFSPGPDGQEGTDDDIGNWPPQLAQR